MAYTRTTWANGSGGGTPLSAANLNNIEVELVSLDLLLTAPATTLPGSPVNGQRAILVDSTTVPTYAWLFQYVSAITDANEWLFLGGSALRAEVDTAQTTSSSTYADLATAGPSITIPRAGIYQFRFGAHMSTNPNIVTAYAGLAINGTVASDNDALILLSAAAVDQKAPHAMTRQKTVATAGHVAKLLYKNNDNTDTVTFEKRWLEVIPVRVA